jgi:nicotinamidase-related amidase
MQSWNDTAVLVIDIQNGILHIPGISRPKETEHALKDTISHIVPLLDRARSSGLPVIYVQHDGEPGHRLEPNTPGWGIREEIAPRPDEQIIRKHACDAFFETSLHMELTAARIKRLVIGGCMTQYCVDTTVRRAVSLGYNVVLLADGHMTTDTRDLRFEQIIAHHNSLLQGFDAGAHVVQVRPSETVDL